jgi:group I intron endonuclease
VVQFNYNGLSESSGIYVIFNNCNWRIYVGSTKRFRERWKDGHLNSLLKGKHSNKFLQADFDKCKSLLGHDDFLEFHVLENMPDSTRDQRLETEEKWIKVHFDNGKQCYNLCERAISREGYSDKNQRKTRKDKGTGKQVYYIKKGRKFGLSPWNKGKTNCYSDETLCKMKMANLGKVLTETHKEKISNSNSGRKVSDETRQKISVALSGTSNGNFGKPMPEQTRLALKKANTGKTPPQSTIDAAVRSRIKTYDVIIRDPLGEEHGPITNLTSFCKDHGLERSLLIKVINGQRTHHRGWSIVS